MAQKKQPQYARALQSFGGIGIRAERGQLVLIDTDELRQMVDGGLLRLIEKRKPLTPSKTIIKDWLRGNV